MEIVANITDFYTNVVRAFNEIDPNWKDYPGLVVVGSHTPTHKWQEKVDKIQYAREHNVPFLGICMGMQLMAVEHARNVLGLAEANSTEIDPKTPHPVVIKMGKLRVGLKPVVAGPGEPKMESFWHNYKINPEYLKYFAKDFDYSFNQGDEVVNYMVAKPDRHPYYFGTQFHPEYESSKEKPHQILKEFLDVCRSHRGNTEVPVYGRS